MKYLYLIFVLFLFSLYGNAQGEYNNWCFGDSTWLDFNAGIPIQNTCSTSGVGAATTSISDKHGNLLFYVDDDSIWDASHNPMLNGIIQSTSVIQSLNAMPFPCNDSLYYIFFFLQHLETRKTSIILWST